MSISRRQFIKSTVAAAVVASLPLPEEQDDYGIVINGNRASAAEVYGQLKEGQRVARLLARSMMQTKEICVANVFNKAFT